MFDLAVGLGQRLTKRLVCLVTWELFDLRRLVELAVGLDLDIVLFGDLMVGLWFEGWWI